MLLRARAPVRQARRPAAVRRRTAMTSRTRRRRKSRCRPVGKSASTRKAEPSTSTTTPEPHNGSVHPGSESFFCCCFLSVAFSAFVSASFSYSGQGVGMQKGARDENQTETRMWKRISRCLKAGGRERSFRLAFHVCCVGNRQAKTRFPCAPAFRRLVSSYLFVSACTSLQH